MDGLQSKLTLKQAELEKMKQDLQKQSVMLSFDAKVEKEQKYQRKVRDFKHKVQNFNEDMKLEEEKLRAKVLTELADVIEKIGKQRGYVVILEKTKSGDFLGL